MKVEVGRIVHYCEPQPEEQSIRVMAAIITHIDERDLTKVNLAAFYPDGTTFPVRNVPFMPHSPDGEHYWMWPENWS